MYYTRHLKFVKTEVGTDETHILLKMHVDLAAQVMLTSCDIPVMILHVLSLYIYVLFASNIHTT